MRNVFAVLDVETGGLDHKENPITQFAVTLIDPTNFRVLESFDTFVKPYDNLKITQAALNRSRVTMDEINAGMTAEQLLATVMILMKKYSSKGGIPVRPVIVGHNVGFDIGFIDYLFYRKAKAMYDTFDRVMYCTLRMIKDFETNVKGSDQFMNNLTAVCERYKIILKSAHGAPADVTATVEVFSMLMKNFRQANSQAARRVKKTGDELVEEDEVQEQVKSRKFFELP
jgi:DNA polymerase III alpha subunit (gram-positive type)